MSYNIPKMFYFLLLCTADGPCSSYSLLEVTMFGNTLNDPTIYPLIHGDNLHSGGATTLTCIDGARA